MDYIINLGKDVMDGYEAAMEQALEKSMAIREAEAKLGNAGTAGIEVRHEGWLQRENPDDRKRADALKANRDRAKLTALHLKDLGDFAANGEQFVLDVVTHLTQITHDLPDEVQPVGEVLTKASTRVLSAAYVKSLQFLEERGSQEIDQATKPRQH